jgi:hypothetical protein
MGFHWRETEFGLRRFMSNESSIVNDTLQVRIEMAGHLAKPGRGNMLNSTGGAEKWLQN